ncbi:hypothetical protein BDZ45DRAFT_689993 [Acephala macrosclerotiorum]|nr:hypothetical protein BDZ45DRAFT_689993 [Acephala macrosclerotiorum]
MEMNFPNLISPVGMPTVPRYQWQHQLTRTNLDVSNAWVKGILAGIVTAAVGILFVLLAALAAFLKEEGRLLIFIDTTRMVDAERFYISDLKEVSGLGVSVVESNWGEGCLMGGKGFSDDPAQSL